ncbi:unnamed protein product [Ectocarpus sp. CCAP 1310/34]|nr:unnamed protein product [Ectocarpus sp. CCAP 1310/34]
MLNPDEALIKDFGLTENCYVHCVITAAPPRLRLPSLTPEQAAEEASGNPGETSEVLLLTGGKERHLLLCTSCCIHLRGVSFWRSDTGRDGGPSSLSLVRRRGRFDASILSACLRIHQTRFDNRTGRFYGSLDKCRGGRYRRDLRGQAERRLESETEEVEDDDPATRRGFDALRNNGMTRGEVTAIRGYFSAQVREVESEELWMRAQPATSEFALNVSMARRTTGPGGTLTGLDGFDDAGSGGTRDFMFGFAMGAFLGVIMLLWLWEAAVPRRQKLGILAGVTFKQTVQMVQAAANRRDEDES